MSCDDDRSNWACVYKFLKLSEIDADPLSENIAVSEIYCFSNKRHRGGTVIHWMAVDGSRSTRKHIEEALQLNFALWGNSAKAAWVIFHGKRDADQ